MARHVLVVYTNAVEGREAEYNNWYTNQHLPDVVRCPGFVSAQRFQTSETQRSPEPPPYKYMAIYEIESDDLAGTIESMLSRVGTDEMPTSQALDSRRVFWAYTPITPVVSQASPATGG
jgi:hypothetical protein